MRASQAALCSAHSCTNVVRVLEHTGSRGTSAHGVEHAHAPRAHHVPSGHSTPAHDSANILENFVISKSNDCRTSAATRETKTSFLI